MAGVPNTLPWISSEIILKVLDYLTDAELLSLAGISKRIHKLALVSHFSRYGITENDIALNSFPSLTTSGAFPALVLARFITVLDELHLTFSNSNQLERDARAFINLVQRLPPISSIELEFSQRLAHPEMARGRGDVLEGMVLASISAYCTRPSVIISPLPVSIIRPRKATFHVVRQWSLSLLTLGSGRKGPLIDDQDFREKLGIFPLIRVGGFIPSISIRGFDPPHPLGTLIILRAWGISDLRFPSELGLSFVEMSAILENLRLPLLCSIEASLPLISAPSLLTFFHRHPTLQRLRLPDSADHLNTTQLNTILPEALPQLEYICGSVQLVAWVLTSAHTFPHLTALTIELHASASARNAYHNALRGIAWRPALSTLTLQIDGWSPWNARTLDLVSPPEIDVPHVAELRLTFKWPSGVIRNPALLVEWLRLFPGLKEVSSNHISAGDLPARMGREFPNIRFTWYKLGINGEQVEIWPGGLLGQERKRSGRVAHA
ncbi:hypothetical protein K438DRAFT_1970040 [Mycena galopus ATCC 62051]|nr:hypothetical protein K438DRAFT_1970040 [Mycena galopus ATCC 62051]